jgi:uncharacterized protein
MKKWIYLYLLSMLALLLGMAPAETDVLPYLTEEVAFTHEDITLAGTLTLPEGPGPYPALITITGSGPQDRDNAHPSIPAYRPFKWLAEHLVEHGVAVLRFDDRGVAESEGQFEGATSADFATDVEAALRYLRQHPEIDPERIGLLGHSEGSMIAAMVAARNPEVAFVVSLAGASVDGYTLMRNQIQNLAFAQAPTEEFAEQVIQMEITAMELALAEDWEALEAHLIESYLRQFEMLPEDQRPPQEQLEPLARQTATQQVEQTYQDPWYGFFLRHDPARDWERVTVPVLLLFGEYDLQVEPELNKRPAEQALLRAGNDDVTTVVLENSNHLFLETETGDPLEYAQLEMAFAPGFLETVTDWLLARTAP